MTCDTFPTKASNLASSPAYYHNSLSYVLHVCGTSVILLVCLSQLVICVVRIYVNEYVGVYSVSMYNSLLFCLLLLFVCL